jgi:hypothetical protein
MAKGEWLTYTVFGAGDATYSVEVVRTVQHTSDTVTRVLAVAKVMFCCYRFTVW